VDKAEALYGTVDALVCNAAINPYYGPMAGISDETFAKAMNVNILSSIWLVNRVTPGMARKGSGSIILISSVVSTQGTRVIGAYAISKAADLQLARNLAYEWGSKGIRILLGRHPVWTGRLGPVHDVIALAQRATAPAFQASTWAVGKIRAKSATHSQSQVFGLVSMLL
jgi:enoyl-[acyl-carrier-protein] reductase (NADH)